MEILIIGGIIVALMAYASTKIKRSAAEAYEEEKIETEEFSVIKPDGFINPIREKSEFALEVYSKDFGDSPETEKLHQARAQLRVVTNGDFSDACEKARRSVDKVLAEETADGPDEIRTFRLQGENGGEGAEVEIYRRIFAGRRKIYDLEVAVLKDKQEAYAERVAKLIGSFRVK